MQRLLRVIAQQQVIIAVLGAAFLTSCVSPRDNGLQDGGPDQQDLAAPSGDMTLPHVLQSMVVSPTNPLIEIDLNVNVATSQSFTVEGHYKDGVVEDVTQQVVWASSNAALGSFTGATLAIPTMTTQSAQVTQISATLGDVSAAAQLTVVAYRKTGDKTDFFFILPFNDPVGAQQKPLGFSTNVRSLDVFFAVDTTGSMGPEIANLQSSLSAIVQQIQAQIPDTQFGVGAVEDFPIDPYGCVNCGPLSQNDQPFRLFQTITNNDVGPALAQLSHAGSPIGWLGDAPESTMEALYQIATGEGLSQPSPTYVAPNDAGVGGVGFRAGTMPVVIPVTDATFHTVGEGRICVVPNEEYIDYMPTDYGHETISGHLAGPPVPTAHNRSETKNALNSICAKVVGVAALDVPNCYTGQADEEDFARATGAEIPSIAWQNACDGGACCTGDCCTGQGGAGRAAADGGVCPLVFLTGTNGIGLGTSIVKGLQMLTRYAPFDVDTTLVGETTDLDGNALPFDVTTADFMQSVVPVSFLKPPAYPSGLPDPTMTASGFTGVTPGTVVTFTVTTFNDVVAQTSGAQLFKATIRVTAGGCTALDERTVLILVPPAPIIVG